ncbi:undecaprenyl-diphosphatase [Salinibacterium sp. CAN_S4]|uniref:phosphatase PAP2 family protein n=1 Tax=Salinibacterium sp. CAN_S4 TaxID=2787727 RepID=UPI0018EF6FEF
MTESAPDPRRARNPRIAFAVGLLAVLACIGGGGVIALLGNGPLPLDVAWFDVSNRTLSPWILAVSRFLNDAGAQVVVGVVLPVAAAILFRIRGQGWAAVAVLLCGILSAPLVAAIKSALERPRPDDQLIPVSLSAYPSGHVANLVAVLVVLALILRWRWFTVLAVVLSIAMALSRTYLNVHWISDDIGEMLLGSGLALMVWGALARRIRAENSRP